jgi:gliding motility associated protien GldN
MKSLIRLLVVTWIAAISAAVYAQERDEFGYNTNSLRPIRYHDQLFKKTLWWRIDLREKQNKPLNARNHEITRIIIDAVKTGIIRPFENDSLKTRMPYEKFMEKITRPSADAGLTDEEKALGFGVEEDAGGWGDEFSNSDDTQTKGPDTYMPGKELFLLELKEDLIFDKKRSRMYRDIQSITIMLPFEISQKADIPIASFSYKELVENVFKDNPDAIWFNNANLKEHRNMAEAFDLRLYAAHLIKYANSDDATIADIYGEGDAVLYASLQIEYALLDFEAQLWEY